MRQSDTPPGGLNSLFKPLSDEIQADIKEISDHIENADDSGYLRAAFNRLMAELHVTSESSRTELESNANNMREFNAIESALDAISIPPGPTLDRVEMAIKRSTDMEAAAPQLLDAVRAAALVLSGDGLSKSLLVRALEKCQTAMRRANGETVG